MQSIDEKELKKRFYWRAFIRIPYKIITILKYFLSFFSFIKVEKYNIERIRNKHDSETVFIFGSGPSIDTYPQNFLDGKISIALQLAFMKYPNATYIHITEADRLEWFITNYPEFFNTPGLYCDPLFPIVTLNSALKNVNIKSPPYYLKYNPKRLNINNIEKEVKAALSGNIFRYHSNSTCLHTAIWCALILGFKTIELIGCDFSSKSGQHYSKDTNVKDSRKRSNEFLDNAYYKMNIFTNDIINISRKYGITINRYHDYTDYKNLSQNRLNNPVSKQIK